MTTDNSIYLYSSLGHQFDFFREDGGGNLYYFNFSTGDSTWEHPCDEFYRKLLQQEREKRRVAEGTKAGKKGKGAARKLNSSGGGVSGGSLLTKFELQQVHARTYRLLRRRGHATPIHQNPNPLACIIDEAFGF
jgi:hypothetical protein